MSYADFSDVIAKYRWAEIYLGQGYDTDEENQARLRREVTKWAYLTREALKDEDLDAHDFSRISILIEAVAKWAKNERTTQKKRRNKWQKSVDLIKARYSPTDEIYVRRLSQYEKNARDEDALVDRYDAVYIFAQSLYPLVEAARQAEKVRNPVGVKAAEELVKKEEPSDRLKEDNRRRAIAEVNRLAAKFFSQNPVPVDIQIGKSLKAYTEFKYGSRSIHITILGTSATDIATAKGLALHEIAHVLYTRDLNKFLDNSSREPFVYNVLEDARIEWAMSQIYPGTRKHFVRNIKVVGITDPVLLWGRRFFLPFSVEKPDAVLADLIDQYMRTTEWQRRLEIVKEFAKALGSDQVDEPPDNPYGDEGETGDGTDVEEGEKTTKKHKEEQEKEALDLDQAIAAAKTAIDRANTLIAVAEGEGANRG